MSGAFNEAADAVSATLGGAVTTIRHWERYAGQDFAQMRELVRAKGVSGFVRAIGAQGETDGVPSADCAELAVQIAVAAPSHARDNALDAAWSALWSCYEALRGTRGGIAWLLEPLRFVSAELEEQSADCAVVSLHLAAHCDLAELDDTVMVPDQEVPTAEAATLAGTDRLTAWVAEGGLWARKYVTLTTLGGLVGGGGGGEVDGGAPDAVYLTEQILDGGTV